MQYFVLSYEVVDDYVERRAQFREQHLAQAQAAHERGEMVMGGALADPVDGALTIFRAADASVVEDFVRNDPYVINGLVTNWTIRQWTVVIGGE